MLDLARGRLGGGLTLERAAVPLEPVLRQIVAEMQMTHPSQIIETNFQLTESVIADRVRISRLLSNLLGNALTYSAADRPVRVTATTNGRFEIAVINKGNPIPAAAMQRLFQRSSAVQCDPISKALG